MNSIPRYICEDFYATLKYTQRHTNPNLLNPTLITTGTPRFLDLPTALASLGRAMQAAAVWRKETLAFKACRCRQVFSRAGRLLSKKEVV